MINTYRINTPILTLAMLGIGEINDESKKEQLKTFLKGFLANDEIRGYQQASGIDKLGRHLLTQIVEDTLKFEIRSTHTNYCEFLSARNGTYQSIIDNLKLTFSQDYKEAVDELEYIISNTHMKLKNAKIDKVKLRRKLTDRDTRGLSAGLIDVNYIMSFATDSVPEIRTSYSANYYRDSVCEVEVTTENLINHPDYFPIENFTGENEVLIVYPYPRIASRKKEFIVY
ncbi:MULTISPECIES: hypothetical protein [Bacillus cereus group]|uniref:hypothetical protein n=1 Tax=Bacillus cereus group TaxID=86661 RepID=UPI0024BC69A2|nr:MULTISPECIES: hypothetical protein [Bacillus cereus group]MED3396721.1 hypothetical protein [Bacillus wiedmannii]